METLWHDSQMFSDAQVVQLMVTFGVIAFVVLAAFFIAVRFVPALVGGVVVLLLIACAVALFHRQVVHAYRVYSVRTACEGYVNFRRHAVEPLDISTLAIELKGQERDGDLLSPMPIVRELFAADARIQRIEVRYRPKNNIASYRSPYLSANPQQTRNWLVQRGDDLSDKAFESWGKKLPQVPQSARVILVNDHVVPDAGAKLKGMHTQWRWALIDSETRSPLLEYRTPFHQLGSQWLPCDEPYTIPSGRRGDSRSAAVDTHTTAWRQLIAASARRGDR